MRGPLPSDQVREIMGAANLSSTAELKAAKRAAKANYAAELQAQMRANEEAKLRERMERMGIARPPPLQASPSGALPGGGAVSPSALGGGMMSFGQASPPGAPLGLPPPFPPPPAQAFPLSGPGPAPGLQPPGSPGRGPAPPSIWSQPVPYQPSPPPYQPPMPPAYQAGGLLGGLYAMPPPNPSPPPQFGGANGYAPQPAGFNSPPQPSFGLAGVGGYGPAPGGGYVPPPPPPLLPGPAPPPGPGRDTMHRLEQQSKKDQYRLELEAQIREREERKAAEKARQREEDMRKEAEMAAAAARGAMGRGGGGAPLRDASGNVVANLRGAMGGMGPPQGLPSPGGMGLGPPPQMGMGGVMQPSPPPPLVGSPPGMGMGMGGPPPPMMVGLPPPPQQIIGGPPMMGSPSGVGPQAAMMVPGGLGGGPGLVDGGPPGVLPNFRFRSDNAYLTPTELDNKQRQMRELQEALEQQIQEKRRAKELERHRELAELEREEARLRTGMGEQRGVRQEGGGGGGGEGRSKDEVLADAWQKARQEAEELRRNKFAAKRGAGGVSRGPDGGFGASPGTPGGRAGIAWGEVAGDGPEANPAQLQAQQSAPPLRGGGVFGDVYPPPPVAAAVNGRPSTPLVVEKVRQVAAAELAAVKQELVAEAAQLREVVAAQGQQVAALKSHAERMEAEAERAREQVNAMRMGLIHHRGPAVGGDPEHELERPLVAGSPPPALVDIDLDLPPTGAMLRRNAAPPPVYDMGPAIPIVNSSILMVDNAAASSINASAATAPGAAGAATNGRPPSRLRAVNPLEASMAGESVFIYPNGKEMGRYSKGAAARGGAPPPQALSPGGGALPFQSIHLAGGLSAVPTVVTTQELEPGPVPATPQGAGPAPSALGGPVLASSAFGSAATSSVAAQSVTASVAASVVAASGAVGNSALEPRRQSGSPGSRRTAAVATPLDVDMVMNRNKEKLEMLQGITDLAAGATSIEALDDFLARYAAQRPGLPERTATPVLRISTPPMESAGAPAAAEQPALRNGTLPASTPLYSSRANGAGPLPMGPGRVMPAGGLSTAGSAGGTSTFAGSGGGGGSMPGSGGGSDGGWGSRRVSGGGGGGGGTTLSRGTSVNLCGEVSGKSGIGGVGGSSSVGGSNTGATSSREGVSGCGGGTVNSSAATGSGRLVASPPSTNGTTRASRRNSFTGERSPQEGVLSQLLEPAPRPKTGPETGAPSGGIHVPSPMPGRPPMLPNTRYSNSGSRGGTTTAELPSGYVPSCASRPASGAAPTPAPPPSRPMRSITRGSEDGTTAASSAWPSYNPSRESSAGGTRLSRSRSLSAHETAHAEMASMPSSASRREPEKEPQRPQPSPQPPPEDTLDVEMRKGLGAAAAAAPPTPPPAGKHGSLPGTPAGKGSSQELIGDSGIGPFQIPRSPLLAGARRTGSAAS